MVRFACVSKTFSRTKVLNEISFDVKPGERVALVGHNGSGKTTLIRCLLGLYHYSGHIEVQGLEVRAMRAQILKKIAFVPQEAPALSVSVTDYLNLQENICGCPKNVVIQIVDSLGLSIDNICDRSIRRLSGGMKQKLLIAAAIARKPSLLVMDEPAANLDPKSRQIFFSLLDGLDSSTTMILSSHRVDELSNLVSRVIELDNGNVALDDVVASREENRNLAAKFNCIVEFENPPDSVDKRLIEWGFDRKSHVQNRIVYSGQVLEAERFRFLVMVNRWSGLICRFSLEESGNA